VKLKHLLIIAVLLTACGQNQKASLSQNKTSFNSVESTPLKKVDDMLLEQSTLLPMGASGLKAYGAVAWSHGVLPIRFKGNWTAAEKNYVFEACDSWSKKAPVLCVTAEDGQLPHLEISRESSGCWSYVGMPIGNSRGGVSTMSLGSGCLARSVIAHELGHAFGLLHEHQRADRDQYIDILWDNVLENQKYNFDILSASDFRTNYDFLSIMHYYSGAFAKGPSLETIKAKASYEEYQGQMGRSFEPSNLDGQALAYLYGQQSVYDDVTLNDDYSKSSCATLESKKLTNILYAAGLFRRADFPSADGSCQLIHNYKVHGLIRMMSILLHSSEFQEHLASKTRAEMISNFYRAFFGRGLDTSGYDSYVDSTLALDEVAAILMTSDEFKNHWKDLLENN